MIDPTILTKEELISNLWLTDEMISEIDIVQDEIEKKRVSLDVTIANTEQEFLKKIHDDYYKSDLYQAHESFQDRLEKIKHLKGIVILIDLILCLVTGYLFIVSGMPLMYVILFWIIVPICLYLIYDQIVKAYLKKNQPDTLPTLDEVLTEAKQSAEYERISDSLLAKHIKQEIKQLKEKKQQLELKLEEKTVLPLIYRLRAREVVWFLENLRADNLKEALAALVDSDHRQQMEETVNQQNHEIQKLKEITEKLSQDNKRLVKKLEQQSQQITELNNRKK